jgi:hypothetical protein
VKAVFGLTISILLFVGMVGVGRVEYFVDTETSTGLQFIAGTWI